MLLPAKDACPSLFAALLVVWVSGWTAVACCAQQDAAAQRPNVILIMADDIGYECFGCYGSRQYQTPTLDQMARDGTRFTHCYAQPLCTPSRVKLMTGMSNARNYAAFSILKPGLRTIGQHFHDAGYRTMVAGKWQLYGAEHYSPAFRGKGSLPEDCGFDSSCLWQVEQLGERYQGPLLRIDGKHQQFGVDRFGPEVVNDHVLQFIEEQQDQPFFIYYPMILVHSPFVKTPDSQGVRVKNRKQKNFEDMVAYMDQMVGRVVEKTRDCNLADRTLILFCGDNGTHRTIESKLDGKTIKGGKGLMTDAGTRVPLIGYWPGKIPAGKVCTDLVDFSDFLPTCLDAAQAKTPEGLDGRTFFPQLQGKSGKPRDWIYIYYCPRPERTAPQRFARDQRWKLHGDGRFYDVSNDVKEKDDLAQTDLTPEAKAAHAKLAKALAEMPAVGQSLWLRAGDKNAK